MNDITVGQVIDFANTLGELSLSVLLQQLILIHDTKRESSDSVKFYKRCDLISPNILSGLLETEDSVSLTSKRGVLTETFEGEAFNSIPNRNRKVEITKIKQECFDTPLLPTKEIPPPPNPPPSRKVKSKWFSTPEPPKYPEGY